MLHHNAPVEILWWLTIGKLVIGTGFLGIVAGALYKFKKAIISVMGILLLSNLVCLYLIILITGTR